MLRKMFVTDLRVAGPSCVKQEMVKKFPSIGCEHPMPKVRDTYALGGSAKSNTSQSLFRAIEVAQGT